MRATQPVVTISGAYGTGGRLVGQRVAEILGVRFLDQSIPKLVAEELAEQIEAVIALENDLTSGLHHWISLFAPLAALWVGPVGAESREYRLNYKQSLETIVKREARHGAVIFGRGAAVILQDFPETIHVRLNGPVQRRIAQAIDVGGLDESTAYRAQREIDSAQSRYVRRMFHCDVENDQLYHLVIDATTVPLATCVDIIVNAVRGCEELRQLGDAGFSEAI